MKGQKLHSLVFKTGIIYVFVTILNVSIFVLMVFENQLDLIAENAVMNSQLKASSFKYRIDNIIAGKNELSVINLNKILRDASSLGITDITVFNEVGKVFVDISGNAQVNRTDASADEMKNINMAVTKSGFEDKLFYHVVNRKAQKINLYIPFTYLEDKTGVAEIVLYMKDIDKQMAYLYRQCIVLALFIIMLHLGFAAILSKMVLIPLSKLNDATRRIAQGDLAIRVPIVGDDEIGRLASSFNEMSVAIQRMRDEARGANPLTGLPGNITIARYIDESIQSGKIICVLYCDLDNFKAYNDKYGFTKGDDAILYTRDCLLSVAKRKDMHDIFVGHEGGDDFVVICEYQYWEEYAKSFITLFDRGIYQFYNSIDARNGFIESVNRRGERQRFLLMSVSVAVVSNKLRPFKRHAEMIQVAAEVKKYVKSIDGSCYAIDRRTTPLVSDNANADVPPQKANTTGNS
jgi:GGDEF domain-containing protein